MRRRRALVLRVVANHVVNVRLNVSNKPNHQVDIKMSKCLQETYPRVLRQGSFLLNSNFLNYGNGLPSIY